MQNKNHQQWTIAAYAMLLVYIALTASIFIYKAKIKNIDQKLQQKQHSDIQSNGKHHRETYNTQTRKDDIKQNEDKVNKEPQSADAHFQLAQTYMQSKGQESKALEHLKYVIQFDQDHPQKKIVELWIKQLEKRIQNDH